MALSLVRRLRRPRPRLAPITPAGPAGPPGLDVGVATAAGHHGENQDRVATGDGWVVVSDGVGGHAGGARAATLAVEAARAVLAGGPGPATSPDPAPDVLVAGDPRSRPGPATDTLGAAARPGSPDGEPTVPGATQGAARAVARVRAAFASAQAAVEAGRAAEPAVAEMAATLVVAVAVPGEGPAGGTRWVVGHVGDSPAWRVTPGGGRQLTDDHTVAGDLLRAGSLTPAEAASHPTRRFVTRIIGGSDGGGPDLVAVDLDGGDALVLATDGLADVRRAGEVAAVARTPATATAAAEALVASAVAAGSTDDVTVAVVRHLASSGT